MADLRTIRGSQKVPPGPVANGRWSCCQKGAGLVQVRAAVLTDYGSLSVQTLELAPPGPGEVLVRIAAAGVCHSDYHVLSGDLPLPVPMVLGHEGAGTVEQVGPGVHSVAPGTHVVLSWLPPCRRCTYCLSGHPELCRLPAKSAAEGTLPGGQSRFRLGEEPVYQFSLTGAFAECTVVPESGVIPIPPSVSLEAAALLGCSVLTGVGAVWRTAHVRPTESIAVFGVGGVGLNVLQGARLVSAYPRIAVDISPQRLEAAREFGATHLVDANREDPITAILACTEGQGVDAAFEAIGRPDTIASAFNAIRPGGRAVVIGVAPPNAEVTLNAFAFPSQEKMLVGSWYGESDPARDIPPLLRLHAAGALHLEQLISARLPLEGLQRAFEQMLTGETRRSLILPSG